MKLISWNIQWCRGCDGRVDPARIGRVATAADDPHDQTAERAGYGSGQVADDNEVAAPQVLAVDHALPDPVVDVEPLELLAGAPVVMPGDEVGLVPDPPACAKPAVGEVVVLGRGSDLPVEAAELEHDRATERHALRVQNEGDDPDVLLCERIVDRRGDDVRIAARPHTSRHDCVPVLRDVAQARLHPRRLDGAVVVRQQDLHGALSRIVSGAPAFAPAAQ